MQQLMQTARMLEAEWRQVLWGSVGIGTKKMSQVLGTFGLLDFTVLWPVLTWHVFLNKPTIYFFNFKIYSGCSEPRIVTL
jgi:hypothetical protein